MAKKDKYNYSSPAAAGLGLAVTGAASMIPATASFAGPLGTMTSGLFGGVNLTDEEMNINNKFFEAINKTWDQIYDDYKLTDVCFSKLRQEVIGENTSTDEFVDNTQRKQLEESYALVTQTILEKYKGGLKRKSKKAWDDAYIKNASKDIASRLVSTLQNVFSEDDLLKILKAIADRSKDIRGDIGKIREADRLEHEQLMQTLLDISESIKAKHIYSDVPPALTTIPAPPDKLIGREKDIVEIEALLAQHRIVYIHSDGGVGKTAVAARIINQIKDEIISGKGSYKHVAWITSKGDLKNDLTGLNIPLVDEMKTQEEKYQIVSTFLQRTTTFLIIDNMDEVPTREELNELNTISGQTKILITSRAIIPYAKEYPIENLDAHSALILFYWHFMRQQMSIEQIQEKRDCLDSEKIVKAATHNALFIELIGKMAYADHWRISDLWEKLSANVFGVNSKHPIYSIHGDGKLLDHIQKLYEMSGLSDRQKEILSFMALFPAENSIFYDVFKWAGFEDDEEDNLGALQDRGWIVRDEEGYLIHTMVRGSVERQVGKEIFDEDRYKVLIQKLAEVDQYLPGDMVYTKVRERVVVPEKICQLLIKKGNEEETTYSLCYNIAGVCSEQGQYEKALEYYEKALEISKKLFEKNHLSTAKTYNHLALLHSAQGQYKKALEYYERALKICEEKPGQDNIVLAMTYNNIALLYSDQGQYKEALEYYKKALEIREKELGEDHSSTATTYNNIAGVYRAQGHYEKALEYYRKALRIREKELGKGHPSTAATYNNMALLYSMHSHYEEALEYYQKALKILEKVLGKGHPSTATAYNNIALLYNAQGQYEKALVYYKNALKIQEDVFGESHPFTATVYNNMAGVYSAQGQYEQSLEYYQKAL